MDSFEREMAQIREQNHYLNRQFNDNLLEMKTQATQLREQRQSVQQELKMLRNHSNSASSVGYNIMSRHR